MNTYQHSEKPVRMKHSYAEQTPQTAVATENGYVVFSPKGTGQVQFHDEDDIPVDVVLKIKPETIDANRKVEKWSVDGHKTVRIKTWDNTYTPHTRNISHPIKISLTDNKLAEWCSYLAENKILTEKLAESLRFHLDLFMRQYETPSS